MTVGSDMHLTWLPAWRIAELIARREVSPVEVLDHFLKRIEELDPQLHAFYYVDEAGAREQAEQAEQAVTEGQTIGPLHGVPVATHDLCKVKGMPAPMWHIDSSEYDDIPVQRLRAAGAIIVGVTNTYTWEPLARPRNPWDVTRDPGNSCRGSAVAVASGMLPATIASDGAGSTRLPASWCGVIGVHPSRGLVPQFHPAYAAQEMLTTTVGPVARDARDAALLLQIIAGPDGRDLVSTQTEAPDYLEHLDEGLAGVNLAWTDDFGWSRSVWSDESAELVEFARDVAFGLEDQGATVRETEVMWEDYRGAMGTFAKIRAGHEYVAPGFFEPEFAAREAQIDEAWGWDDKQDGGFAEALAGMEATTEEVHEASLVRERCWQRLREVLGDNDALLSVTTPLAQKELAEWGLGGRHYAMTTYSAHTGMFNFLGFPGITVPCGLRNGLPVGLHVATLPGNEDVALRIVNSIQKANDIGHPPLIE